MFIHMLDVELLIMLDSMISILNKLQGLRCSTSVILLPAYYLFNNIKASATQNAKTT